MANKSIIDIEVNDSQFKAFHEIYQALQGKIEAMPADSKRAFTQLGKETKKTIESAGKLTKEMEKATKAQKEFHQATRGSDKSMSSLVKHSEKLSKNIFGIGKFLMKMGTLGVGLGIGGLFGMELLGRAAVSGQRQARGLGLTQGQIRAFSTDFGRYVNPDTLSNMAGAQSDFQKRAYLAMAAGVSYQQAGTMKADQLAIRTAMRAHEWWKKTPAEMRTEQTLQAAGFGQIGYTMEDMRRLGNTPLSELQAARSQYGRDVGKLGISDRTTQEWYQLTRRLKLAGQTIEVVLINKLGKLAPTLGKLVTSFTDDVTALIKGITPKEIDAFISGFKSVAEYLGSKETLQNLKDFLEAVEHTAKFINALFDIANPKPQKGNVYSGKVNRGPMQYPKGQTVGFQSVMQAIGQTKTPISRMDMQTNLIAYQGDLKKAIAAYTWGTGPLNKDIQAHGGKWEQYAPQSTQRYINSVIRRLHDSKKIDLRIENKTGSNLFVSANAAAH